MTKTRKYQKIEKDVTIQKANNPEKSLVKGIFKTGGRNNMGRITTRHKGGGAKRLYRKIPLFHKDIKEFFEHECKINSIEYDPNRTANISLIENLNGLKIYIPHTEGTKINDSVKISLDKVEIKPGNVTRLKYIPVGSKINSLQLKPNGKISAIKSAGSYGIITGIKDDNHVSIKLPSSEEKILHIDCIATIGSISNASHKNEIIGKAGKSRHLGIRPTVRGIVMNPVDHPLGGGNGKSKGRHPVSPWGQCAKGKKTRHNKLTDRTISKKRVKK